MIKVLEFYNIMYDACVIWDQNQYNIVVPLFGAAYAQQFYANFPTLISPVSQSSNFEVGIIKYRLLFFII